MWYTWWWLIKAETCCEGACAINTRGIWLRMRYCYFIVLNSCMLLHVQLTFWTFPVWFAPDVRLSVLMLGRINDWSPSKIFQPSPPITFIPPERGQSSISWCRGVEPFVLPQVDMYVSWIPSIASLARHSTLVTLSDCIIIADSFQCTVQCSNCFQLFIVH
jgi:hypothetical protein